MPQANAASSIALSSAIEPVASPGARMNSGVPVSTRTASCEVAIAGARIERMRGVGGRLEEIVERAGEHLGVMVDRGQPAIAVGADAQSSGGSASDGRPGRTCVRGAAPA